MERQAIEEGIKSVILKPRGEAPAENELWTAEDGEALVQVFRATLQDSDSEGIFMIVRGPAEERGRIFTEFTDVLGMPFVSMRSQDSDYDGYTWRVEDIGKSNQELTRIGEWVVDVADVNMSTWN